jgi:hypothetical protein
MHRSRRCFPQFPSLRTWLVGCRRSARCHGRGPASPTARDVRAAFPVTPPVHASTLPEPSQVRVEESERAWGGPRRPGAAAEDGWALSMRQWPPTLNLTQDAMMTQCGAGASHLGGLGPRWSVPQRSTLGSSGRQRSPRGSEEPQITGPPTHAAGMMRRALRIVVLRVGSAPSAADRAATGVSNDRGTRPQTVENHDHRFCH